VQTRTGEVRFAVVDQHKVVRVDADTGNVGVVVLALADRECGAIKAASAGSTIALTVACDESYAADTAPTKSVALVTAGSDDWEHHDLAGEAFQPAAVSPAGTQVVWPQGKGVLRWSRHGGFDEASDVDADAVAVTDDGTLRGAQVIADADGSALRITEGKSVTEVRLPAHQGMGDAEYDGVQFDGVDTIVVATPEGVDDVRVLHRDGRWAIE